MKKNILLFALGVLAFASCSSEDKEIISEETKSKVSFSVSSSHETRAYWSANKIYWNSDDQVMVYATNHTDGDVFKVTNYLENEEVLSFEGQTYLDNDIHTHSYIVVYPAANAKEFDATDLTKVIIPDEQNATVGSFDRNACVQVGKTSNLNYSVNLDNVCAFLKIEVTAPCDYVKISTDGTFGITGTVWANGHGVVDSKTGWVERKSNVTLKNLPEAGIYLIAIAPSSSYPELNVEVKYPGCDPKYNKAKNVPIERGYVYDLGRCNKPVSVDVTTPDMPSGEQCECGEDCGCDPNDPCEHEGCPWGW